VPSLTVGQPDHIVLLGCGAILVLLVVFRSLPHPFLLAVIRVERVRTTVRTIPMSGTAVLVALGVVMVVLRVVLVILGVVLVILGVVLVLVWRRILWTFGGHWVLPGRWQRHSRD
jgi:hypothetical protein